MARGKPSRTPPEPKPAAQPFSRVPPLPPDPPKMGRPTKLTPDVQLKVCIALAKGHVLEYAAAFAGISISTLYAWLKLGDEQEEGPYRDFLEATKAANSACIGACLDRIWAAPDWQSLAWLLERRFSEYYGRNADLLRELLAEVKELRKIREHGPRDNPPAPPGETPEGA